MSAYVERFRGNDDLLADVEKRQKAADRLADLLQGWLASQLEGEPGLAKLRGFLQDGLRRDLINLSLYTWAYGIVWDDDDEALSECLVRVGQYLVERSYFSPDQLPAMTRAVREADRDGPARLLGFIQRFIASKMGVAEDEPLPKGLDFLSNPRAVTASINGFLRQTKEFKSLQRKWEGEKATNPKLEPPDPSEMLIDLAVEAFFPIHLGPSDRLGVKLAATTEPFLTNGQWDDKAKRVQWSDHMLATDSKHSEYPALLYAFWSKPDEQAQKASFGRVVLEGSALGNYCLWYRGLSTQEAKEWDKFISSLRPDNGLVKRLRKFRFSHEPPAREDDEMENDLASTPRELILQGLRGEAAAK